MKQSKYSDAQIMGILKQAEGGVPVSELCRDPLPGRILHSNVREGWHEQCQLLQVAIQVWRHGPIAQLSCNAVSIFMASHSSYPLSVNFRKR